MLFVIISPCPTKGLIYRFDESKASDIVLIPRLHSLHHCECKHEDSITLCNAFDEDEKSVKLSQQRGTFSKSVVREFNRKYFCVGNQTNRGGVGIRRFHKALLGCPQHISSRIMKYFKNIEHLFCMFMDTE